MSYPDFYRFPENHPPSNLTLPVTRAQDADDSEPQLVGLPPGWPMFAMGFQPGDSIATGPEAAFPDAAFQILFDAVDQKRLIWNGIGSGQFCPICRDRVLEAPSPDGDLDLFMAFINGNAPAEYYEQPTVCSRGDRALVLRSNENLLVRGADRLFLCPSMVVHYIEQHGYRPPVEFTEAVLSGTVLGIDALPVLDVTVDEWMATFAAQLGKR